MRKAIFDRERPTRPITMRVPEDVLADLKRLAPLKGLGGYQGLIKLYIGQGLRRDLEELSRRETAAKLREVLERRAVAPEVIQEAVEAVG